VGYPESAPDEWAAEALDGIAAGGRRHRAVTDTLRWFDYRHLRGAARDVSALCAELAVSVLEAIDTDDPELTRGLADLITVKDHLVRAAIVDTEKRPAP
jgi:hypothetical protein